MAGKIPPLITHLRRVAIVGLPNSGKTVLLTSLLMHLENLSPALTDGTSYNITSFRPQHDLKTIGKQLPDFPYNTYRRLLIDNGDFPAKTKSESIFAFDLALTQNQTRKRYQIELLDVPGERFYDVKICDSTYNEWCDNLERLWQSEPHPAMDSYRKLFDRVPHVDIQTAVGEYRKLLAHMVADYRTSISPSTFRVSRTGNAIRGRTVDALLASANANPCGVDLDRQFSPIFRVHRGTHDQLVATMSAHYDAYRSDVVTPLFAELKLCDRLVILIDVPYLLAAGPGAFEDQNHLIEQVLDVLVPKPGVWSALGRAVRDFGMNVASTVNLSLRPGKVERVAFVGTKADLCAVSDVRDNRLSGLLSQLAKPKSSYLNGIDPSVFVISAIKSTVNNADKSDNETEGFLTGRLQFNYNATPPARRNPADPEVDYSVTRLPKDWPRHWEQGHYSFPPVYPELPRYRIVCPEQVNLKDLFEFIVK